MNSSRKLPGALGWSRIAETQDIASRFATGDNGGGSDDGKGQRPTVNWRRDAPKYNS